MASALLLHNQSSLCSPLASDYLSDRYHFACEALVSRVWWYWDTLIPWCDTYSTSSCVSGIHSTLWVGHFLHGQYPEAWVKHSGCTRSNLCAKQFLWLSSAGRSPGFILMHKWWWCTRMKACGGMQTPIRWSCRMRIIVTGGTWAVPWKPCHYWWWHHIMNHDQCDVYLVWETTFPS